MCCSVLQRGVLQCVVVCCCVLQCVIRQPFENVVYTIDHDEVCVAVCCSVVCFTVLQCVSLCCTVLHCVALIGYPVENVVHTGWRRLIGSPKLQIIFHKRATKHRSLSRKMTYKDKGSYESSPACMNLRNEVCYSVVGLF